MAVKRDQDGEMISCISAPSIVAIQLEQLDAQPGQKRLPLFPLIGNAVSALPTPYAPPGTPLLAPVTDHNYSWL